MSDWTQPICDDCWDEKNPSRVAARLVHGHDEVCCHCGKPTRSGIYTRTNPDSCAYPTRETIS